MGLEFAPESLDSMRNRYKKAVAKVWVVDGSNMKERPGLFRDHVFDFESGIRLLISNDKIAGEDPVIHISASYEGRPGQPVLLAEFEEEVTNKWRSISGCGLKYHLHLIGISPNSVPHWWVCGGENESTSGRAS